MADRIAFLQHSATDVPGVLGDYVDGLGLAVSTYRADHGAACPKGLGDLVALGYLHADAVDAWGRPLRLECPGRRDALGFDLSSDGPDGLPGGLDRVQ